MKKFPFFMKYGDVFPFIQEPAAGFYPNPDESISL
jgi:hypothetical protein